jgi:aminoglycoside phosphotransferase (APT) family kinase protein
MTKGVTTPMGTGVGVASWRPAVPRLMWRRPSAVASWLAAHREPVTAPVAIGRVGIGQSNITSIATDAHGWKWVLREPPAGTAYDVQREANIIRALAGSGIPVSRVVGDGYNRDGGSFFIMEWVAGAHLESEDDAGAIDPRQRHELGLSAVRTLARLHTLDPAAMGLTGSATPYVQRQIRRMSEAWLRLGSDSPHDPAWRAVRARLLDGLPPQRVSVVAHGDFRLPNLLLSDGHIAAVLDWELCTVGDPLADLAWLLDDWRSPEEPAISIPSPTRAGGFPTRAELVETYVAETGFRIDRLGYYRGFAKWRAASLLHGVLTRRSTGVMGDHGAIDLDLLNDSIATLLTSAAVTLTE